MEGLSSTWAKVVEMVSHRSPSFPCPLSGLVAPLRQEQPSDVGLASSIELNDLKAWTDSSSPDKDDYVCEKKAVSIA